MCRLTALLDLTAVIDGYSIGTNHHDYFHRNILAMHKYSLSDDFLINFEEAWYERHLVPNISSSFTAIGHDVVYYLWENLEEYFDINPYSHLGVVGHKPIAELVSNHAQLFNDEYEAWLASRGANKE